MSNKVLTYRLRTFINATHAVRWQGVQGVAHPHTWELILDIQPMTYPQPMKFEDIETVKKIEKDMKQHSKSFKNGISFEQFEKDFENEKIQSNTGTQSTKTTKKNCSFF